MVDMPNVDSLVDGRNAVIDLRKGRGSLPNMLRCACGK